MMFDFHVSIPSQYQYQSPITWRACDHSTLHGKPHMWNNACLLGLEAGNGDTKSAMESIPYMFACYIS